MTRIKSYRIKLQEVSAVILRILKILPIQI